MVDGEKQGKHGRTDQVSGAALPGLLLLPIYPARKLIRLIVTE